MRNISLVQDCWQSHRHVAWKGAVGNGPGYGMDWAMLKETGLGVAEPGSRGAAPLLQPHYPERVTEK